MRCAAPLDRKQSSEDGEQGRSWVCKMHLGRPDTPTGVVAASYELLGRESRNFAREGTTPAISCSLGRDSRNFALCN